MPSDHERSADHNVLVVGLGSIGFRHARNLRALGIRHLAAYDPCRERLETMTRSLGIQPFADLEKAMTVMKPDIVFVCSPPVFHIQQALQAVRAGAHIFIEKPLSHELEGVDELIAEVETRQKIAQVGYNLRFHPAMRKIKELVEDNTVGRILWARAEFGQYLPDWHPLQDYRESYTGKRDLGGGIILDASHELDYIIWLLGEPTEVKCTAAKVSHLEVDVEDCATLLLRFSSGAQADIHMDFVQRAYSRSYKFVGTQGTIVWDYQEGRMHVYHGDKASWQIVEYACDNNDMYVAEVQHFLDCVDQGKTPLVDLNQAKAVLMVALAAKSAATQSCVKSIS